MVKGLENPTERTEAESRDELFEWFVACQKRHGLETVEISVPTLPKGVLVQDPKVLEFILKHEALFTKGQFFRQRSWDLFGNGIINSDGTLWKLQRKAGVHFFSGASLRSVLEDVLPNAYQKTRRELHSASDTSNPIDLERCLLDLTTRVVGKVAYDVGQDASSPFSAAFDYCSGKTGERFQNPVYPVTELFSGSRFRENLATVRRFGRSIVAKARERHGLAPSKASMNSERGSYGSLLSMLVHTLEDEGLVQDAALNFLSAGRDTTAQSLTWTFYLLGRHPLCLATLRREISTVFPQLLPAKDPVIPIGSLQPQNLPWTMAIFYESLRLRPPVPFEIKQCTSLTKLPDGTTLPKGSVVLWAIWAMNRSHEVWGPNAGAFVPERWLDGNGKFRSDFKSAFEFPVFNAGPRACLGKKMAELMAMYVLVTVISEFDVEEIRAPPNTDFERKTKNSLTLPMEGGLPCRIRIR
ncbi:MAG: hypothetical protein Q9160_007387 [Pyrenula sp. 1 TL-2023]